MSFSCDRAVHDPEAKELRHTLRQGGARYLVVAGLLLLGWVITSEILALAQAPGASARHPADQIISPVLVDVDLTAVVFFRLTALQMMLEAALCVAFVEWKRSPG
ncbi:hypothetical protein [Deinococcus sonorensis]|uniref:Uncharacterized protein n=3 Tax=Deinococcus sonorensis TaxID=309891 RepID=A0AAU7U6F6_9DEIO